MAIFIDNLVFCGIIRVMPREKRDIFGTPPEEWDRIHTIPMPGAGKSMPSMDEHARLPDVRETPKQQVLFDRVADIVGDPEFVLTSLANIMMKVALWRSVEHGDLTHMQGAELERRHGEALTRKLEEIERAREAESGQTSS